MNRLRTIIVGVDFSDPCMAAVRQAIRIAQWNNAAIHAIHVVDQDIVEDMKGAYDESAETLRAQFVESAHRRWEKFIAELSDAPPINFIAAVGHPAATLIRFVGELHGDLLVLCAAASSHTRGSGSTAGACTRKAPTRVLLIDNAHSEPFRNILACIDFSPTSFKSLEDAVRIAAQDKATLHILHVFDGPWNHLHYRAEAVEVSPDFQKQYTEKLKLRMKAFAKPVESELQGLTTFYHVIDYPSHGAAIVTFALDNNIDLVAMGTHGRANLRDLFMGSTAEKVLRETPCSMLTVKPERQG